MKSRQKERVDFYLLGRKHYNNEKYPEAMEFYRQGVQINCPRSQTGLGLCYAKLKKYQEAIACYKQAADQKYAGAQLILANMYERGEHEVAVDLHQALHYYHAFAAQDEATDAFRKFSKEKTDEKIRYLTGIVKNLDSKHTPKGATTMQAANTTARTSVAQVAARASIVLQQASVPEPQIEDKAHEACAAIFSRLMSLKNEYDPTEIKGNQTKLTKEQIEKIERELIDLINKVTGPSINDWRSDAKRVSELKLLDPRLANISKEFILLHLARYSPSFLASLLQKDNLNLAIKDGLNNTFCQTLSRSTKHTEIARASLKVFLSCEKAQRIPDDLYTLFDDYLKSGNYLLAQVIAEIKNPNLRAKQPEKPQIYQRSYSKLVDAQKKEMANLVDLKNRQIDTEAYRTKQQDCLVLAQMRVALDTKETKYEEEGKRLIAGYTIDKARYLIKEYRGTLKELDMMEHQHGEIVRQSEVQRMEGEKIKLKQKLETIEDDLIAVLQALDIQIVGSDRSGLYKSLLELQPLPRRVAEKTKSKFSKMAESTLLLSKLIAHVSNNYARQNNKELALKKFFKIEIDKKSDDIKKGLLDAKEKIIACESDQKEAKEMIEQYKNATSEIKKSLLDTARSELAKAQAKYAELQESLASYQRKIAQFEEENKKIKTGELKNHYNWLKITNSMKQLFIKTLAKQITNISSGLERIKNHKEIHRDLRQDFITLFSDFEQFGKNGKLYYDKPGDGDYQSLSAMADKLEAFAQQMRGIDKDKKEADDLSNEVRKVKEEVSKLRQMLMIGYLGSKKKVYVRFMTAAPTKISEIPSGSYALVANNGCENPILYYRNGVNIDQKEVKQEKHYLERVDLTNAPKLLAALNVFAKRVSVENFSKEDKAAFQEAVRAYDLRQSEEKRSGRNVPTLLTNDIDESGLRKMMKHVDWLRAANRVSWYSMKVLQEHAVGIGYVPAIQPPSSRDNSAADSKYSAPNSPTAAASPKPGVKS